jgi:hypothetical protein
LQVNRSFADNDKSSLMVELLNPLGERNEQHTSGSRDESTIPPPELLNTLKAHNTQVSAAYRATLGWREWTSVFLVQITQLLQRSQEEIERLREENEDFRAEIAALRDLQPSVAWKVSLRTGRWVVSGGSAVDIDWTLDQIDPVPGDNTETAASPSQTAFVSSSRGPRVEHS